MKNILLLALPALVFTTACKKDDTSATAATMQVTGTLNAAAEPAGSTSTATGNFTGTYNPTTKVLTYSLTFSGLSGNPTAAHFHYGNAKIIKGDIWLPIANLPTATSGTVSGTYTLTNTAATSSSKAISQPDSLLSGHMYANIHTVAYPAGEIRSSLVAK